MASRRKPPEPTRLLDEWTLSSAATFGSSVRTKGIVLEIRAHLPLAVRKMLDAESGALTLRAPETSDDDFCSVVAIVATMLETIESLPVIPREVEDILAISAAERHRWLKDGRLQTGGTRTVKLRGRARQITFHVFEPQHIEDVLDRDMVSVWREDDKRTAAENRRRAAGKAALKRAQISRATEGTNKPDPRPEGFDEFESDGFLR